MKRFFSIILCLGTFSTLTLSNILAVNPSDTGAMKVHARLYANARRNLLGGTGNSKVRAALFFGARKNPRYVRLLGRELIKELNVKSSFAHLSRNDPYVKSNIAWALGEIKHKKALLYLLIALERVAGKGGFLDKASEKTEARQKREEKRYKDSKEEYKKIGKDKSKSINDNPIRVIIEKQKRPGPLLYKKYNPIKIQHSIPYSPDIFWSISDEFKTAMAPNKRDSVHQIRLKSFNYINLTFYIMDGIGNIYSWVRDKRKVKKEHVDSIGAYLNHRYSFIRGASAITLGKIGSKYALKKLIAAFEKEKDNEVKAKISGAILIIDKTQSRYLKVLLELLNSDDDYVRYAAAVALRELALGELLPYFKSALELEDVNIVRNILKQAIERCRVNNLYVPQ